MRGHSLTCCKPTPPAKSKTANNVTLKGRTGKNIDDMFFFLSSVQSSMFSINLKEDNVFSGPLTKCEIKHW